MFNYRRFFMVLIKIRAKKGDWNQKNYGVKEKKKKIHEMKKKKPDYSSERKNVKCNHCNRMYRDHHEPKP